MIILKDLPGLTPKETLDALHDIVGPDVPIDTGYGGFVVSAAVAHRFLGAYLTAAAPTPAAPTTRSAEPVPPLPDLPPPAAGSRRGTTRRKAGES
jgi:hypothetical protein